MICRYGSPEVLNSDQGREFVNEISSELYSITKTEYRITSAYHPQVCAFKYYVYLHCILTVIHGIYYLDQWADSQSNAVKMLGESH